MKKLIIPSVIVSVALLATACGGGSSKTATPAAKATVPAAATKAAVPTTAAAPSPETAELANEVATLKTIMNAVIAKAKAGDLQGTKDTEGTMDDPMEAIIKAVRPIDAALADSIEQRELAIEKEADAATTDLNVIATKAAEVLPLLDQVVTRLKLTGGEAAPSTAELAADIKSLKTIMNDVIAKAKAGQLQATKDAEGTMDDPMEALIKAVRAVDPALADSLEQRELAIEKEADATTTDLNAIAKSAQEVLPLLDQAAAKLKITP